MHRWIHGLCSRPLRSWGIHSFPHVYVFANSAWLVQSVICIWPTKYFSFLGAIRMIWRRLPNLYSWTVARYWMFWSSVFLSRLIRPVVLAFFRYSLHTGEPLCVMILHDPPSNMSLSMIYRPLCSSCVAFVSASIFANAHSSSSSSLVESSWWPFTYWPSHWIGEIAKWCLIILTRS